MPFENWNIATVSRHFELLALHFASTFLFSCVHSFQCFCVYFRSKCFAFDMYNCLHAYFPLPLRSFMPAFFSLLLSDFVFISLPLSFAMKCFPLRSQFVSISILCTIKRQHIYIFYHFSSCFFVFLYCFFSTLLVQCSIFTIAIVTVRMWYLHLLFFGSPSKIEIQIIRRWFRIFCVHGTYFQIVGSWFSSVMIVCQFIHWTFFSLFQPFFFLAFYFERSRNRFDFLQTNEPRVNGVNEKWNRFFISIRCFFFINIWIALLLLGFFSSSCGTTILRRRRQFYAPFNEAKASPILFGTQTAWNFQSEVYLNISFHRIFIFVGKRSTKYPTKQTNKNQKFSTIKNIKRQRKTIIYINGWMQKWNGKNSLRKSIHKRYLNLVCECFQDTKVSENDLYVSFGL